VLGQGVQCLFCGPASDGDLVKGTLAGFPELLLFDEALGPLPSPGIDRGQVKPECVDDLAGQVFDREAFPVGRFLRDDQLLVDQNPEGISDGALGQAGTAHQVVIGGPDEQPLPLLLAPAGDKLGQDGPRAVSQFQGFGGIPGGRR
jgi:hypothetical protein